MYVCPNCEGSNLCLSEQVYARSLVEVNENIVVFLDLPAIDLDDRIPASLMCLDCNWFVDDPVTPLHHNLRPETPGEDLPDDDF